MERRDFIHAMALCGMGGTWAGFGAGSIYGKPSRNKPNIVFILADQWRSQATGYADDTNARTPNLDRLASQGVNLTNAVSGCSVCCPYRASLLTGQHPLTHGVFLNDLCLSDKAVSIAQAYAGAGYDTAYIGKWHLDGHGRSNYIPPERRQGFDYWKVLECTHNYNQSFFYAGNDRTKRTWEGYDAIAQTSDAMNYIRSHSETPQPFFLLLSWGPPHAPYGSAPEKYRNRYNDSDIVLRPNVPEDQEDIARKSHAGYYAHIAALDDCLGDLMETLKKSKIAENTLLVFTSDHGDMLYSHGMTKKQQPWDESIRVPFLLRYPRALGDAGKSIDMPFATVDIMPTLLGLSEIKIPKSVEGEDYSKVLRGEAEASNDAALITCPSPFGQWPRGKGREYRGIRTRRYTYVRDLNGPWLLYDNEKDPHQLINLVGNRKQKNLQKRLETLLALKLRKTKDAFLPGETYIKRWGYTVKEETGTVPYSK